MGATSEYVRFTILTISTRNISSNPADQKHQKDPRAENIASEILRVDTEWDHLVPVHFRQMERREICEAGNLTQHANWRDKTLPPTQQSFIKECAPSRNLNKKRKETTFWREPAGSEILHRPSKNNKRVASPKNPASKGFSIDCIVMFNVHHPCNVSDNTLQIYPSWRDMTRIPCSLGSKTGSLPLSIAVSFCFSPRLVHDQSQIATRNYLSAPYQRQRQKYTKFT